MRKYKVKIQYLLFVPIEDHFYFCDFLKKTLKSQFYRWNEKYDKQYFAKSPVTYNAL